MVLALGGALGVPSPALAASHAGPFRLAPGHAARPALYFSVGSPGTVRVQVDTAMDEPISVTLYAGATAVHRAQGRQSVRFTVDATRSQIGGGKKMQDGTGQGWVVAQAAQWVCQSSLRAWHSAALSGTNGHSTCTGSRGDLLDPSNTAPVYAWNNDMPASIGNSQPGTLLEGRDWIESAEQPSALFQVNKSTDDCTSSYSYTPYTYPHPLGSGS